MWSLVLLVVDFEFTLFFLFFFFVIKDLYIKQNTYQKSLQHGLVQVIQYLNYPFQKQQIQKGGEEQNKRLPKISKLHPFLANWSATPLTTLNTYFKIGLFTFNNWNLQSSHYQKINNFLLKFPTEKSCQTFFAETVGILLKIIIIFI